MSDGQRYICKAAPCDHERKTANHWFVIWIGHGDPDVKILNDTLTFQSAKFDEDLIACLIREELTPRWVCGQQCAQKLYELFLQTGGIDPVKSPASQSINPKPGSEGSRGNESSGSETGIR